jgi:hypothetical protein
MKNSGLLLLLIGIFIFLNATNFTDVIRGRSTLSFLNPKESTVPTSSTSSASATKPTPAAAPQSNGGVG